MTFRATTTGLCLCLSAASVLLAGCSAVTSIIDPNAAQEREQYQKKVSSGYTGCEPADNVISDSTGDAWHVTCKARTYVCTDVSAARSATYACAPAAQ